MSKQRKKLEKELKKILAEKKITVKNENFEKAAELFSIEKHIKKQIEDLDGKK